MHLVTHTCGAQLWRHQTGGVRQIVIYGRVEDQREIHDCPHCGKNLCDRDLTDERGDPILPPRGDTTS